MAQPLLRFPDAATPATTSPDYLAIAPRYGNNDDLVELVGKARDRGIRVLLDLVGGHTSIAHPWFRRLYADGPTRTANRYVWAEPPQRDGGDLPG